jgi:hypothetical protein
MNTYSINDKNDDWLQIVRRHVEPLNYGSVEIVVHDSRIVQIDKTQRWRLPEAPPAPRREKK